MGKFKLQYSKPTLVAQVAKSMMKGFYQNIANNKQPTTATINQIEHAK